MQKPLRNGEKMQNAPPPSKNRYGQYVSYEEQTNKVKRLYVQIIFLLHK